jgi:hypothetical protein
MPGDGKKRVTAFGVARWGGDVVKRGSEADWQSGPVVAAPDRRDGGGWGTARQDRDACNDWGSFRM